MYDKMIKTVKNAFNNLLNGIASNTMPGGGGGQPLKQRSYDRLDCQNNGKNCDNVSNKDNDEIANKNPSLNENLSSDKNLDLKPPLVIARKTESDEAIHPTPRQHTFKPPRRFMDCFAALAMTTRRGIATVFGLTMTRRRQTAAMGREQPAATEEKQSTATRKERPFLPCHCEERSDVAIHSVLPRKRTFRLLRCLMDCFVALLLAMTRSSLHRIRTKILRIIHPVSGVAALEVVLTLPIICMLIFASIEILKMHIAKNALDAICAEATFVTIAHGSKGGPALIQKIDAIIEKYRPKFIPDKVGGWAVIRYEFETYTSLENLCGTPPYGGFDVHYPGYESDTYARNHSSQNYNGGPFLPSGDTHWHNRNIHTTNYAFLTGSGFPSGNAFVVTFSCAYQFSSSFVKRLFFGGTNTRKCNKNAAGNVGPVTDFPTVGDIYLIWARGIGIVN